MKESARALRLPDLLRLLAGLFVQPFVSIAVAYVMFPLLLLDEGQALAGGYPSPTDAALSIAFGAAIVAGLMLGAVLPTAVWQMARGRVTLPRALVFGVAFGIFPYAVMGIAAGGTYGVNGLVRGLAFSAVLGMSGAAAFWLIALRPHKMRESSATSG